ncbi:MAG: putative hemolysin [Verrucomicrobiales bacterium]|jgi:putative hemolysin
MPTHIRFDPATYLKSPLQKATYRALAKPIDSLLSISKLENYFNLARTRSSENHRPFNESLHKEMDIRTKIDLNHLGRIPRTGPVVIVSNHPFGLLDASILCEHLSAYRPDCKFLANYMVAKLPEAAPYVIPVNPFDTEKSTAQNLRPMREAMRWLRSGKVLITFPAGEVAHLKIKNRGIIDGPWSPHMASLIHRTGATVIPIYISGRNSVLFQTLGLVHPLLRTALLARELTNKRSREIEIQIGSPIPASKLDDFDRRET